MKYQWLKFYIQTAIFFSMYYLLNSYIQYTFILNIGKSIKIDDYVLQIEGSYIYNDETIDSQIKTFNFSVNDF